MTRIFIEGAPDKQKDRERAFIEQILSIVFPNGVPSDVKFINAGGWKNWDKILNQFRENTDASGKNLVIYDADFLSNDGGFNRRLEQIANFRQINALDFELFLFPNHQDDGDFETLLEYIVNQNHRRVIDCFTSYESCLKQYNQPNKIYETPNQKTKMYAFVESFLKSNSSAKKFKDGDWFFDNSEYWDFSSPHLDSLKNFLLSEV